MHGCLTSVQTMKTLKDTKNCVEVVFMHVLIIVRLVLNGHFSAHPMFRDYGGHINQLTFGV